MQYLSNLDLRRNQLMNAAIHPNGTAPLNPVVGQIYFDTTFNELRIYDGTAWDIVGKEYTIGNDIMEGSIVGNTLYYKPFVAAAAGKFSYTNTTVAGTTALAYSGHLFLNDLNVNSGTAQHVLYLDANKKVVGEAQLSILRGGTGIGSYAKGDILWASATNTLSKLGIGAIGQVIKVGADSTLAWSNPLTVAEGAGDYTVGISFSTATGTLTTVRDTFKTVGDTNLGAIKYNGLTRAAGQFYGGTTNATSNTRLNYDGYLYATQLFDNEIRVVSGINVTGTGNAVTEVTKENNMIIFNKGANFLTAETDTLHSVAGRGSSTNVSITIGDSLTLQDTDSDDIAHIYGPSTISIDPAGHNDDTGQVIIRGNLIVQGQTTTVNSTEVAIGDRIIKLNKDQTGTPTLNAGIEIERGDLANAFLEWNESLDLWTVNGLPIVRKIAANIVGNGTNNSFNIVHNLSTTDLTFSIKDVSENEIVYTDIFIIDSNTIQVLFGFAPESNKTYRVTITG